MREKRDYPPCLFLDRHKTKPKKSSKTIKIKHTKKTMPNWLPFDANIYAPMVQNIQNEVGVVRNPPVNNWTDARKGALRDGK